MKINLPSENWVDFFKLLSREQLASLLPHIGDEQEEAQNRPIADRQFVSYVQFYLHECGNVTLGEFSIKSSSKGPVFVNNAGQKLLLAKVPPMPSNIKSFKKITINYYDESVLGFLQEFRRNSLLTNVNLILWGDNRRKFDAMSKMMTQLLPSITSIESLTPECKKNNTTLLQEHSDMLTSARILIDCGHFCYGYGDWYRYHHWLHIPRDDGKPRVLKTNNVKTVAIPPFIEKIKKDFLDANQAVSFFAEIYNFINTYNVQFTSLANDKTQEKLVIYPENYYVIISRYPTAKEECIKKLLEMGWINREERKIEVNLNIKSGYFTFCSLI